MKWISQARPPMREGKPVQSGLPTQDVLLRWLYVGRISVASAIFLAVMLKLRMATPQDVAIVSAALVGAVAMTGASIWYSGHQATVGPTFLYLQAVFDLALVTTVVHVTGGPNSEFFSLYILVIALAALMMPEGNSLLVGVLAGLLYFGDIFWGHPVEMSWAVWLQLGVFAVVASATAYLGSRVRVVGAEKAALEQELSRVQLEAVDILENISSGVISVDVGGQLLYANPAAERILGLSRVAWNAKQVLGELARISPAFLEAIQTASQRGTRVVRAEADVHLSDRAFLIGVTTTTFAPAGGSHSAAVTAIFSDISDQKRIEELRLRAERLEAIAALSASLAHEIKNPLASIRSAVEQLTDAGGAVRDEKVLAQLIVRESDRLSRLLSEFLDFSRVRVTQSQPVDLREVAESAVQLVREHPDCGEDTQITVGGRTTTIEGDEDLLYRTVLNLVLNAVQAGGNGVRVSVRVGPSTDGDVPVGVTLAEPVKLEISDNGPGIPQDLAAHMFEPFVTGRQGGSGLGLAIVQRAVAAHRGVVLVDSGQGRGTTFTILLPSRGSVQEAA